MFLLVTSVFQNWNGDLFETVKRKNPNRTKKWFFIQKNTHFFHSFRNKIYAYETGNVRLYADIPFRIYFRLEKGLYMSTIEDFD